MGKLGQYEDFESGIWEGWSGEINIDASILPEDFVDIYSPYYDPATNSLVLPSDISTSIVSTAASSGSSLLDAIKSILGIAAPVAAAALTADQKAAAVKAAADAAAAKAAVGTTTTSAAGFLSGITSNLPLLAVIAVGGYFLFGRKGGKGSTSKR